MVSSIAAIDINNMWVRILVLIPVSLKALDTFGNCQRPVFSLGVSIGRQSCERIMEEKTPLSHKLCAFRCLNSRPQLRSPQKLQYFRWGRYSQCFISVEFIYVNSYFE